MSKAFVCWARCYRLWTFSVTRFIFYRFCTTEGCHSGRQKSFQVSLSPMSVPTSWPGLCLLSHPQGSLYHHIPLSLSLLVLSASRPYRKVLWFCFVLVWGRVWWCCSGCPEMSGLRLSSCLSFWWGWDHRCVFLLSDNGKVFEGGLVLSHPLVKYN